MLLDQETKDQVQAYFNDWRDEVDRRAATNTEIKETIEATSQLLNIDKKAARKMFKIMDKMSMNDEYSILQICEEIVKKD